MTEEDKGFNVVDRRPFDDQGNPRQDEPAAKADEPARPAGESQTEERQATNSCPGPRDLPPVDFSGLVLSLATAAMTHLGVMADPTTGQQCPPDLVLARHTIDTLGMLKEKTTGNLDDAERRLLDNILTDLRLAYVSLGS